MDFLRLKIKEIVSDIKNKKYTSQELTQFYLDRINKYDKKLNSFISVSEKALEAAKLIDEKLARGEELGPLAGVPIAVKDMICTRGLKTTAASKMLQNFIPPYDATLVQKLKNAGAIVIGKTNLDEFAMGSSNETSFFGSVKNPWNTDYVPGGSSGGSASAQSAGLAVASIGTDTGGSIRQPASFCGVVGLKPTYGRVSRYGIIAYASSLDQAGPMTNSVEDSAILLEIISGHDPKDSTSSSRKVENFSKLRPESLKNYRIGILQTEHDAALNANVSETLNCAQRTLGKLGANFVEIKIESEKLAVPVYYLIASSEASSNLSRYDGVRFGHRHKFMQLSAIELNEFYSKNRGEGFGQEVKRRIMLGTFALSSGYYDAYYNKACQVRRLITNQYKEAFNKCDVILSPVTATPAFKIGERISDPLTMYLNDIFTTSTNLAGLPGMSLPFGLSTEQLPIGIQLTADHFQEEKMLRVALALEKESPVLGRRPHEFT